MQSVRQCYWAGIFSWNIANADRGFCTMNNVSDVNRTSPWRLESPDNYGISKGVVANTVQSPCQVVAQAGASSGNTFVNRKSCQHVPRLSMSWKLLE